MLRAGRRSIRPQNFAAVLSAVGKFWSERFCLAAAGVCRPVPASCRFKNFGVASFLSRGIISAEQDPEVSGNVAAFALGVSAFSRRLHAACAIHDASNKLLHATREDARA